MPTVTAAHEVLVHNLGHHDLWLLLDTDGDPQVAEIKNHKTTSVGRWVSGQLGASPAFHAIPWSPGQIQSQRFDASDRAAEPEPAAPPTAPQLRGWVDGALPDGAVRVAGFTVPLLAAVLAAWSKRDASRRTLLLVHSASVDDPIRQGADTLAVATVLERWVRAHHPEIAVRVVVGLQGNPFQFSSEAMAFDALHAHLATMRMEAARAATDGVWRDGLRLSLSASTGTFATQWGLASALRGYEPTLFHVPTAHRRPEVETLPAVNEIPFGVHDAAPGRPLAQLHPELRALSEEMRAWKAEFTAYDETERGVGARGIDPFWWRKSKQKVLSLLMVRGPDGAPRFHRGCNLEVSMPTGSLCAERNVIGTALALDPGLQRWEILAVAVLGLSNDANPLDPCGVCAEWLAKIAEVSPDFRVVTFTDVTCESAIVRRAD